MYLHFCAFSCTATPGNYFSPTYPWGQSPSVKAASPPKHVTNHASSCTWVLSEIPQVWWAVRGCPSLSSHSTPSFQCPWSLMHLRLKCHLRRLHSCLKSEIFSPQGFGALPMEMNKWCRLWLIKLWWKRRLPYIIWWKWTRKQKDSILKANNF